jgi:hypothetical protein
MSERGFPWRDWWTCMDCLRQWPPEREVCLCQPLVSEVGSEVHECISPGCTALTESAMCDGCYERYVEAQS